MIVGNDDQRHGVHGHVDAHDVACHVPWLSRLVGRCHGLDALALQDGLPSTAWW